MEINKIYNENCLDTMARMEDNFIDLTVTSPPYDGLRTYNGYSFDFENIAKELFRVTKDGGVVVWVISDETKNFCESGNSFRQALYMMDCGFNLLDTMIYNKANYAPAYPTMRRYAQVCEYMFVLSKGRPNTFNPIQVAKVRNKTEKGCKMRQKDGTITDSKIITPTKKTKDANNLWVYPSDKSKDAKDHPAVFPEKLANDHIISWSNEGDIVYDPFMGSGTTAKMAKLNNRNWIGSEISEEYCKIIAQRLQECGGLF